MAAKKTVVAKKAPAKRVRNSKTDFSKMTQNELISMMNSLQSTFGGPGYGPYQGMTISQVNTLFDNLRYYLVSNMRQPLSQCYVEIALIQTICDVPVDDGLRGGVDIKTKQLDEDQIHQLRAVMERQADLIVVAQANKWNRLFGGAGIVTITDQDSKQPLDVKAIGPDSKLAFRAVDMWELFTTRQDTDDYGNSIDAIDGPDLEFVDYYQYYSLTLHHSRVMPMIGMVPPSFIRPRLRGWGVSVVEALIRSMNQYLKATDLGFEVLDEFKLDIYKIKGLTQALLSPNGQEKVRQRIAAANLQKNYQNALVMDAEDDYIQKQLTWAGLGEAMDGIRKQIASDMRMPMIKLFGQSAGGGLGSTGEDEIEVYNAMVESQVRAKCKFEILRIVELRCQKLFGFIPDDLTIEFQPLRVLSAEQEENVKTQTFQRILQARQAGEITSLEFREACNKESLLPVELETDASSLLEIEEENTEKETADSATEDESEGNKIVEERSGIDSNRNSSEYDEAAYETYGGDDHVADWKLRVFSDPSGIQDMKLWKRAVSESNGLFGEEKQKFIIWVYERLGGKLR